MCLAHASGSGKFRTEGETRRVEEGKGKKGTGREGKMEFS